MCLISSNPLLNITFEFKVTVLFSFHLNYFFCIAIVRPSHLELLRSLLMCPDKNFYYIFISKFFTYFLLFPGWFLQARVGQVQTQYPPTINIPEFNKKHHPPGNQQSSTKDRKSACYVWSLKSVQSNLFPNKSMQYLWQGYQFSPVQFFFHK